MAQLPRILIAGAYGTFGRLLAHELHRTTSAHLLLAGRNPARASAFAQSLSSTRAEPLQLDLADPAQLARAADGCLAVACAAGPFQRLDPALPAVAIRAGAHWVDVADHPPWIRALLADRALDQAAQRAGLSVLTGQSSVPALAGVLVQSSLARFTPAAGAARVARAARVALFIGGRNAKGSAAVASALETGLDSPIAVTLPTGTYTAYRFGALHADLLTDQVGLPTEFRVAFESSLAGRIIALLSRLTRPVTPTGQDRLARVVTALASPLNHFGSHGGALQADVWDAGAHHVSASLTAPDQRLAVLPCALALESLLDGSLRTTGVLHPWHWLAPAEWIARLEAKGTPLRWATALAGPSGCS